MLSEKDKSQFYFTPLLKPPFCDAREKFRGGNLSTDEQIAGLLLLVPDRPLDAIRRGFELTPELYLYSQPNTQQSQTESVKSLLKKSHDLCSDETAILGVTPSIAFLTLLRTSEGVRALTDFRTAFGDGSVNSQLVARTLSILINREVDKQKGQKLSDLSQLAQITPFDIYLRSRVERQFLCRKAV